MSYVVSKSKINSNGSLYMSSLGSFEEKEDAYIGIETDIKRTGKKVFAKNYKVLRNKNVFVASGNNTIIGYQIISTVGD